MQNKIKTLLEARNFENADKNNILYRALTAGDQRTAAALLDAGGLDLEFAAESRYYYEQSVGIYSLKHRVTLKLVLENAELGSMAVFTPDVAKAAVLYYGNIVIAKSGVSKQDIDYYSLLTKRPANTYLKSRYHNLEDRRSTAVGYYKDLHERQQNDEEYKASRINSSIEDANDKLRDRLEDIHDEVRDAYIMKLNYDAVDLYRRSYIDRRAKELGRKPRSNPATLAINEEDFVSGVTRNYAFKDINNSSVFIITDYSGIASVPLYAFDDIALSEGDAHAMNSITILTRNELIKKLDYLMREGELSVAGLKALMKYIMRK